MITKTYEKGDEFTKTAGPIGARYECRYLSTGVYLTKMAWGKPGVFVKAHKWMKGRNEFAKTAADVFISHEVQS